MDRYEAHDLSSLFSLISFYDRYYNTDFGNYMSSFKKSDNIKFKEKYGYYPVFGKLPDVLYHLKEHVLETGIENFSIYSCVRNPNFEIHPNWFKENFHSKNLCFNFS